MATPLLILCGCIGLFWTALTAFVLYSLGQIRNLHPPALITNGTRSFPRLSVIIPARNEAATLEPAMRSLLSQEGVNFEVILVNDHSTDATGAIADRIAAENPRLRVLHNPELPPGWLGKVNAMQKGSELATGDVLLFSDADIHFRPGCLAAALGELQASDYDFLSLLPELIFVTVMENALAPIFFLAVPAFAGARLDDPESPDAVGAGAFLMIRRETYNAVGRHEQLRKSAVDDVQLARLVKRSRHRVGVRLAPELVSCRMYLSNRQAFWAIEKNIMESVEGKPWAPLVLLPGLTLAAWSAPVTALVGLVTRDPLLFAAGLILHTYQSMSFQLTRRFFRFQALKLFLYPLGVFSVAACTFKAIYHRLRGGGVIWRGRVVKLD